MGVDAWWKTFLGTTVLDTFINLNKIRNNIDETECPKAMKPTATLDRTD